MRKRSHIYFVLDFTYLSHCFVLVLDNTPCCTLAPSVVVRLVRSSAVFSTPAQSLSLACQRLLEFPTFVYTEFVALPFLSPSLSFSRSHSLIYLHLPLTNLQFEVFLQQP